MSYIKFGVSIFLKVLSFIKSLFWRNKNVVYINSNKQIFSTTKIKQTYGMNEDKPKLINCQDKYIKNSKFPKAHFIKQKISLFQIKRNMKENCKITYGGFASTPLAAYDGCSLGDTQSYKFVDLDARSGSLCKSCFIRKKTQIKREFNLESLTNESALFIDSSQKINIKLWRNIPITRLGQHKGSINRNYLNYVYNFVYSYMQECLENNITRVHLFIAAKQPVSFIVGTAIHCNHPEVISYEFYNGKYTWGLNLKTEETTTYGSN